MIGGAGRLFTLKESVENSVQGIMNIEGVAQLFKTLKMPPLCENSSRLDSYMDYGLVTTYDVSFSGNPTDVFANFSGTVFSEEGENEDNFRKRSVCLLTSFCNACVIPIFLLGSVRGQEKIDLSRCRPLKFNWAVGTKRSERRGHLSYLEVLLYRNTFTTEDVNFFMLMGRTLEREILNVLTGEITHVRLSLGFGSDFFTAGHFHLLEENKEALASITRALQFLPLYRYILTRGTSIPEIKESPYNIGVGCLLTFAEKPHSSKAGVENKATLRCCIYIYGPHSNRLKKDAFFASSEHISLPMLSLFTIDFCRAAWADATISLFPYRCVVSEKIDNLNLLSKALEPRGFNITDLKSMSVLNVVPSTLSRESMVYSSLLTSYVSFLSSSFQNLLGQHSCVMVYLSYEQKINNRRKTIIRVLNLGTNPSKPQNQKHEDSTLGVLLYDDQEERREEKEEVEKKATEIAGSEHKMTEDKKEKKLGKDSVLCLLGRESYYSDAMEKNKLQVYIMIQENTKKQPLKPEEDKEKKEPLRKEKKKKSGKKVSHSPLVKGIGLEAKESSVASVSLAAEEDTTKKAGVIPPSTQVATERPPEQSPTPSTPQSKTDELRDATVFTPLPAIKDVCQEVPESSVVSVSLSAEADAAQKKTLNTGMMIPSAQVTAERPPEQSPTPSTPQSKTDELRDATVFTPLPAIKDVCQEVPESSVVSVSLSAEADAAQKKTLNAGMMIPSAQVTAERPPEQSPTPSTSQSKTDELGDATVFTPLPAIKDVCQEVPESSVVSVSLSAEADATQKKTSSTSSMSSSCSSPRSIKLQGEDNDEEDFELRLQRLLSTEVTRSSMTRIGGLVVPWKDIEGLRYYITYRLIKAIEKVMDPNIPFPTTFNRAGLNTISAAGTDTPVVAAQGGKQEYGRPVERKTRTSSAARNTNTEPDTQSSVTTSFPSDCVTTAMHQTLKRKVDVTADRRRRSSVHTTADVEPDTEETEETCRRRRRAASAHELTIKTGRIGVLPGCESVPIASGAEECKRRACNSFLRSATFKIMCISTAVSLIASIAYVFDRKDLARLYDSTSDLGTCDLIFACCAIAFVVVLVSAVAIAEYTICRLSHRRRCAIRNEREVQEKEKNSKKEIPCNEDTTVPGTTEESSPPSRVVEYLVSSATPARVLEL